jgi:hypothetical protein
MHAQSRDWAEDVAGELASSHQVDAAAFACDIADDEALERLVGDMNRPPRQPRQRHRLQQIDPLHRPRRHDARALGQDQWPSS